MEKRKNFIRIPPQNIDSEKALLGSIMISPSIIPKIKKIIKSNYFYDNKNRDIFFAMCYMESKGIHIDLLTLSERLKTDNKLDYIGGISYLTELVTVVPSSSNAEEYARIIKDKYKARKVIETSEAISKMVCDNGHVDLQAQDTLKKLLDECKHDPNSIDVLERLEREAKEYSGEDRVISFKEIEKEIRESPAIPKISSSIITLDNMLHGGFMTQTVTTIAATPKSGKTTFCMYLTTLLQEYNPMWLALEESTKSLIRKLIKNGMEVPNGYTPAKKSTVTIQWCENKIYESKLKYGTKVVFIDQLDFIVPQDGSDGRHDLKIAQAMRDLHDIAVRHDIAIFLICHLEKMEPEQKPTTKNLRGSSAIWGEADNCIFLWRECWKDKGELVFTNNLLLSLQANREDGDTGNVKMTFQNGRYIENDWVEQKVRDESFGDFADNKLYGKK